MSCLLFLSSQEVFLFFRATYVQVDSFFKETDQSLLWPQYRKAFPQTPSPIGLLGVALEPGRTFPVNSCTEEACCCELLHSN